MIMKKFFVILLLASIVISCGSSAVVNDARRTMKGDWTLNNITYPGNTEALNVRLFEDSSASCLENSSWTFISNNNTGSYDVINPQCNTGPRFFRWSVDEANAAAGSYDFMLKPTDADYKSTSGNQGFRINLVRLTDTDMVWEQTVNFEGEPFTIKMNFSKN